MVDVFSPLWPGKAGWSLASQRWLEVNDLGRLVNTETEVRSWIVNTGWDRQGGAFRIEEDDTQN